MLQKALAILGELCGEPNGAHTTTEDEKWRSEKPSPQLSEQEKTVLVSYVSGMKLSSAARCAGVRPGTAKQYLERVKLKYEKAGRPARTKLELLLRAREDGLIN